MNERIKELATKAGMVSYPTGIGITENTIWGDRNIEKFVKLIIEDFGNIIIKRQYRYYGDIGDIDELLADVTNPINTQFGVNTEVSHD